MAYKHLLFGLSSKSGRNKDGRITVFSRGGGHKQRYAFFLHNYDFIEVKGIVVAVKYCSLRSAFLGLVCFSTGHYSHVLLTAGVGVGKLITSSFLRRKGALGDTFLLKFCKSGDSIHSLESYPFSGSLFGTSAGSLLKVVKVYSDLDVVLVRLSSGELRLVKSNSFCVRGQVSNIEHKDRRLEKAGVSRWLGRRPVVRGVAMNPIDHPHGGGEGKTSGGRPSSTPWGRLSKGVKTRRKNKKRVLGFRRFSSCTKRLNNVGFVYLTNFSKIKDRSRLIMLSNVGKVYSVHNGKEFLEVFVEESMVGQKWGSFAFTRKGAHTLVKKKKGKKVK